MFLKFIYTGVYQVSNNREINQGVSRLAEEYHLTTLKSLCQLAVQHTNSNQLTALAVAMRPDLEFGHKKPRLMKGKANSQLFPKKHFTVVECFWNVEGLPDVDQVFSSDLLNFRIDGGFRAGLADHPATKPSTLLTPQYFLYLACSHLEKTGTVVYHVDSFVDGTDYSRMDRTGEEALILFGRELYDLKAPMVFKFDIMIRETVVIYLGNRMTMDTTMESGRDSNMPKNQPKRSFDVAFLTGVSEAHQDHQISTDEEEEEDLRSVDKKSVEEKSVKLQSTAGSPKSAFKKVSKVSNNMTEETSGSSSSNLPVDLSLMTNVPPYYHPFSFPAIATTLSLQLLQQNNAAKGLAMSFNNSIPASLASAPSQNVCAKCNLSFRMTSDLVYHMRSQHRRDASTDPVRQKRQEKLRCPVCGENFRERHHLTRHMTSHEDRELEAKEIHNV
nr:EOG090X0POW [Simocephalus serrulatus]